MHLRRFSLLSAVLALFVVGINLTSAAAPVKSQGGVLVVDNDVERGNPLYWDRLEILPVDERIEATRALTDGMHGTGMTGLVSISRHHFPIYFLSQGFDGDEAEQLKLFQSWETKRPEALEIIDAEMRQIQTAITKTGVQIVNLSMGTSDVQEFRLRHFAPFLKLPIQEQFKCLKAMREGANYWISAAHSLFANNPSVAFVLAAGNDLAFIDEAQYHSAKLKMENVLVVGALGDDRGKGESLITGDFSTHFVGVYALGKNILTPAPGGTVKPQSGSSVATAIVSGELGDLSHESPQRSGPELIHDFLKHRTEIRKLFPTQIPEKAFWGRVLIREKEQHDTMVRTRLEDAHAAQRALKPHHHWFR